MEENNNLDDMIQEDFSEDIIESYGENDEPIVEKTIDDETVAEEETTCQYDEPVAEKPKKASKVVAEKSKRPLPEYDRNYDPDDNGNDGRLDYLEITKDVYHQMYRASNLRRLQTPAGILWAIAMLPFYLASVLLMVAYYVALFVFKMITNPADYLVSKLRSDAPNKWTTIVTFFIGYPIVFLYRAISAVLSIQFFILHFFISLNCYIFSFGGVTFHPFLFDTGYKRFEEDDEPYGVGHNVAAYIVSILIILLVVVYIIVSIVSSSGGGGNSNDNYYPDNGGYEDNIGGNGNNNNGYDDNNNNGYDDNNNGGSTDSFTNHSASSYSDEYSVYTINSLNDIRFTGIYGTEMVVYFKVGTYAVSSIKIKGNSSDFNVIDTSFNTWTPDYNDTVRINNPSTDTVYMIVFTGDYYGDIDLVID